MANMRIVAGSFLMAAGLALGWAFAESPPAETKGVAVEVLTQKNEWIKFELREVVHAYNDSTRLSFVKKLEPMMSQMAWSEIPIAPDAKRGLRIREIRMADEGQKFKDAADGQEYLFYSVVLVPRERGTTSSWYWQATGLAGVIRGAGAPKPFSIPLSDVKVVRFPQQ